MIRPSELVIQGSPFVGTLKRAEHEAFAAIIVMVCKLSGDKWRHVTMRDVDELLVEPINQRNREREPEMLVGLESRPTISPRPPLRGEWATAEIIFRMKLVKPGQSLQEVPEFFHHKLISDPTNALVDVDAYALSDYAIGRLSMKYGVRS